MRKLGDVQRVHQEGPGGSRQYDAKRTKRALYLGALDFQAWQAS